MPYIKSKRRNSFEYGYLCRDAGELNYLITRACLDYMSERELSYQLINEVMGVLESAKQEFYRRVAAPYEDEKIKQNGDVY